ncbi:patatin-like phospholipase family protein [Ottowia sp. GY511]|uniref:Patatin-like phospholipase family protein n=1 Tax=Ottowia flava TaxID=2675430 RepID=A0ABW4L061_9BURK|nr:patatin-like phospholipase family protein [Ottowia sp. GY511]TXK31458.1 patatin-like phospholipase family protein [Ottowia sp. GY511]
MTLPSARPPADPSRPHTGLVLSGGGARAAYQVGVLRAIRAIRREAGMAQAPNPFPIVCGTSAGAINAAALAAGADHFDTAVRRLTRVWTHIHAQDVYRADAWDALRAGTRWVSLLSLGWALTQLRHARPRSLLDNAPLGTLLRTQIPLGRIPLMLANGHLQALSIAASSYATGEHVTFYESAHAVAPWSRAQRNAVSARIGVPHLLASSAIPFIFPAGEVAVDGQDSWYGDGTMRQVAPMSPAIHLGADRVLVIGAGRANEPRTPTPAKAPAYPTLAQVAGHALSSIFLDTLAADIERTQRINHTLSLIAPQARSHSALRSIDLLVISPSQRLDDLALQHVGELPGTVRTLLGILGVRPKDRASGALASYLLFEPGYTRALMQLGWSDALRQRDDAERFFGWQGAQAA